MKIRLVLYSLDRSYREHLVNYLSIHHGDTLEINIFNETQALEDYLKDYRTDIILLDQELSCKAEKGERLIRLSEERGSDPEDPVIFKYQREELIYKAILNAFASGTDRILHYSNRDGEMEVGIDLFLPLNGGAGASTVAKAYAVKLASNRKVLYLNLELFGDCEKTLKADGQFSFDDILYAVKNRRGNLTLKMESALKKSREGVFFYAPSENPVNLMDFTEQEFHQLVDEIRKNGMFDCVVLDMDGFPSPWMQGALKDADRIWLVADGTAASSEKYDRFRKYIVALEKRTQSRFFPKMRIFYNKYSRRTGSPVNGCDLPVVGGSPRYEYVETDAIIRNMAESDAFEKERV